MSAIILPRIDAPICGKRKGGLGCTRARGHEGRHAATVPGWELIAVWGDDVHAEARSKGRVR